MFAEPRKGEVVVSTGLRQVLSTEGLQEEIKRSHIVLFIARRWGGQNTVIGKLLTSFKAGSLEAVVTVGPAWNRGRVYTSLS